MNATKAQLEVEWHELVWAALTVGRPDIVHVFQHGLGSVYEAMFRVSMVLLALEQRGIWVPRFQRTDLFNEMDPSEKGAINYFLGLVVCKLFASRLLAAPWTLHLDVFKDHLNPQLLGRSRPDMVAQSVLGDWHAFECKGRASTPSPSERTRAKQQAMRLVSVDNVACTYHIGAITYFTSNALTFYWRDPEPTERQLALPAPKDHWAYYYQPSRDLVRSRRSGETGSSASLEELDITIEIQADVMDALEVSDWSRARLEAGARRAEIVESGYEPDGIRISTGPSWREPRKLIRRR